MFISWNSPVYKQLNEDIPMTETTTQPTEAAETKAPVMSDIKKQFYSVDNIEAGSAAATEALKIVEAASGKSVLNFDPEQDFPEGYGLAVGPINKRNEALKKTETIGCYVAAVPSVAHILETAKEAGQKWIDSVLEDSLIARVANAVRPRSDGSTAASVPFSVEDFITSNRPEGLLVGFNKLAPTYVKVLKGKGLTFLTTALLRQILSSKAFAEQQFPKIPQASWESLLDSMIAKANKDGLTVGLMDEWKETRDEAGLPVDDDLDLSDLDFGAIGEKEKEPEAQAETAS